MMLFDKSTLFFLLIDSLLGLGGIFFVLRYSRSSSDVVGMGQFGCGIWIQGRSCIAWRGIRVLLLVLPSARIDRRLSVVVGIGQLGFGEYDKEIL
jgi:hypothetical protein